MMHGIKENESEWLDECKKLKLKDENKKIVGKVVDLVPKKEGLLCTFEIFNKADFDRIIKIGDINFINACKYPNFRVHFPPADKEE